MGAETSKAIPRRLRDPAFHQKYFVGTGIDVGAGGDPLSRYVSLFPRLDKVLTFDLPGADADFTGDATTLAGLVSGVFDFVHSSHCLEHLADPMGALENWLRVTKPGGHVIVIVPDEQLYEHETWPSIFNMDHKHSFRMGWDAAPACKNSVFVPGLFTDARIMSEAALIKCERLEATFLPGVLSDQTIGIGECAIEFVLRKL